MKTYSKLEEIKIGQSNESVINGCLVLEGGAFRGIYSEGVLDVLLENDINMQCTIGTSAGALNGVNYVAGQYGRSARASLGHRHDKRFVGTTAFMNNQGIIGFNFLFEGMNEEIPFDSERKLMTTVNQVNDQYIVYTKGGIDELLARCNSYQDFSLTSMCRKGHPL